MQPWPSHSLDSPDDPDGSFHNWSGGTIRHASILHNGLSVAGDSQSLDSTCPFIGRCVVYRFRHKESKEPVRNLNVLLFAFAPAIPSNC